MPYSPPEITRLPQQWSDGDRQALDRLTPLVCGQPRRLLVDHVRAWLSSRLGSEPDSTEGEHGH